MGERDTAQAMELVRALRDQLREMTRRMARLEDHLDGGAAVRLEAAGLRRDIHEAQRHIDRLERHYGLGRDAQAQPSPPPRRQAR